MRPDYILFSWLAMLFTSSIGIGIIYFGVNEPFYAYDLEPRPPVRWMQWEQPSITEVFQFELSLVWWV